MATITLHFNRRVPMQIKGRGRRKIAPFPFPPDTPMPVLRRMILGEKRAAEIEAGMKKTARA
jgi:hypothetical protein